MTNTLQLDGKTILVTGASAGIGRTTSVLLSNLGARVVLVARNEARLQETLSSMKNGQHWIESHDLSQLASIPEWFPQIIERTGPLDGLVHCAGTTSFMTLRTMTTEHLDAVMRINFYAAVSLCKEFSRKQMHCEGASIVLVASLAGMLGLPAQTAYSGSKGALLAFGRSAAIELAKRNIRVNCVAPGAVQTEMYDEFLRGLTPEQLAAHVESTYPLGIGQPIDVAHAISFLLGETARWITGSVLVVDGGYSAR